MSKITSGGSPVQGQLRDMVGVVLDHCSDVNMAIKWDIISFSGGRARLWLIKKCDTCEQSRTKHDKMRYARTDLERIARLKTKLQKAVGRVWPALRWTWVQSNRNHEKNVCTCICALRWLSAHGQEWGGRTQHCGDAQVADTPPVGRGLARGGSGETFGHGALHQHVSVLLHLW